ncbi:MAG TPA: hypothetical protein VIH08_08055, partial [Blastococcus sp.]
ERRVLEHYLPAAAVSFPPELLPHGGATECWSAHAGYPDLADAAEELICESVCQEGVARRRQGWLLWRRLVCAGWGRAGRPGEGVCATRGRY